MTDVRELVLPSGHVALFDEAAWPLLSEHRWFARPKPPWTTYVITKVGPSRRQVLMHRLILGAQAGQRVDHINHNGLDNRRANLRFATPAQNAANSRPWRNNTSGYRGVSWRKDKNIWSAQIQVDGRLRHLGFFLDAWSAAQAYNEAAREAWGEFAVLNESAS